MFKNYGKKSKLLIRIATAAKGLTGTIAGYAYFADNNPDLAMKVFFAGAVANEVINFLSNGKEQTINPSNQ